MILIDVVQRSVMRELKPLTLDLLAFAALIAEKQESLFLSCSSGLPSVPIRPEFDAHLCEDLIMARSISLTRISYKSHALGDWITVQGA
jgi:hypothetical protein